MRTLFKEDEMELVGWIGGICLALCGLPQAIHSFRTKSAEGVTWSFLTMWMVGEVATFAFIIDSAPLSSLIVNYSLNIVFVGVILYFKVKDALSRRS